MGTGNTRLSNQYKFASMYEHMGVLTHEVAPGQRCPIAHLHGAATVPPTEPPLCQLPGQHSAEPFVRGPEREKLMHPFGASHDKKQMR